MSRNPGRIRYNTIMPKPPRSIDADWYQASFDALYPVIYAHRNVDSARREAEFSIEQCAVSKSDAVLDLCCGNGRHMAHLINQSRRVVGVDLSPHLLTLARELQSAEAWMLAQGSQLAVAWGR